MAPTCQLCNASLTGKEKYCPHCGSAAPFLVRQAGTVTCPRCGQKNIALSAAFCPNCGLQRTVPPTPTSTPSAASMPSQPSGMSTTARNLWIISILAVLALFACCVVLAYTSEFKLSPSTN
jgi:uncharacterized Zn finger protein (UPF0148 family)